MDEIGVWQFVVGMNNVSAVEAMLQIPDTSPNELSQDETPLQISAREGKLDMLHAFLEKGAEAGAAALFGFCFAESIDVHTVRSHGMVQPF